MNPARLVYIVVLNYRNFADTVECVRSLERLVYRNFKIVVVDNGSPNESEEVLRRAFPHHTVLQSGANLGYAGGNNVGLRFAFENGADFALILNNDTLVEPDLLSQLVDCAESDARIGLVGGMVIREDTLKPCRMSARRIPPLMEIFWNRGWGRWLGIHSGLWRRSYYEGLESFDRPARVDIVSGACMMLRRELVAEVGFLDEKTFLFWEEFILAEKIRQSSFVTMLAPSARVIHKLGLSVRDIGVRAAWASLHSLNYYLKEYRDVGFFRRMLILTGPVAFFLPGTVLTVTRLRRAVRN